MSDINISKQTEVKNYNNRYKSTHFLEAIIQWETWYVRRT